MGVPAPEPASRGDPGLGNVGREDVEAKRLEREALEARYGSRFRGSSTDFPRRLFCTSMPVSESDSSGSSVDMGGAKLADGGQGGGRRVDRRHSFESVDYSECMVEAHEVQRCDSCGCRLVHAVMSDIQVSLGRAIRMIDSGGLSVFPLLFTHSLSS